MKKIESIKWNLLFTSVLALVCFLVLIYSPALEDAGMASIIVMWIPFLIGIVTIVFYFLIRLVSTKYAWVATFLGGLLNILLIVQSIFSN